MPKLAANLSMMFTDVPFLERFGRAAAAGFRGVEFLFPYEHAPDAIAAELRAHGLTQALFNLPPGDWAAGERGTASLPGREAEFRQSVGTARRYAQVLGCRTIHCMAGMQADPGAREAQMATYADNLAWAAAEVAQDGLTLVIEPINTRDMPGYLLNHQRQACTIIEQVGAANLRLQLDLYHCQIMEGDLARHIDDFADITAHVQVAGVPERHEPDVGEVAYPYLLERLDGSGYAGWVGCEYRPRGRTEDGLAWARPWLEAGSGAR